MKKSLLLLSIVLLAFAACNKEPEPVVVNNEDIVLTFTSAKPDLEIEDEAGTRTAWDNTTSSIVWQSTDKIKVGFTFDGAWWGQTATYASTNESPNNHIKFYQSSDIDISGISSSIATFTVPGTFTGPVTSGDFVFYSVYPAALVDNNLDTAPSATVTLKTNQAPAAGSFDATTDIMVGTSAAITSTGLPTDAIELNWNRVVAHAALTFSNMAFNGAETPTKITLTFNSDAKVAGSFSVNIADGTIGTGSDNEIVLEGSGLVVDGSSITTWATVLPVTFTSLDVEVKTDKATYTRSITGISKTFKKNARNTLTINMSTAVREAVTQYDWVVKNLADITSSDVFVIVGNNGSNYAMNHSSLNSKGAPIATAVTVTGTGTGRKLSTSPIDGIKWNLTSDANGYIFYPDGDDTKWLNLIADNNGLRINNTAANGKYWSLDATGYLKGTDTKSETRYIGVYNSTDWRSYTSTSGNIANQSFAFYVRAAVTPAKPVPTISFSTPTTEVNIGESVTNAATISVDGLTITYSSSDETVASVDTSTGEVTGVAVGTATITASFAGNSTYDAASAEYDITVVDPNANDGTESKPYTASEAAALALAGNTSSGVYVVGIITAISTPYNSTYDNISFDITDDGLSTSTKFRIYRATASSADDFKVGDWVKYQGTFTKYNTTPEFAEGNTLISQLHAPSFSPTGGNFTNSETVTLTADPGAQIRYTLDGTDPTPTTGTVYSSTIELSSTTTIKALAVKDGASTGVVSATYTKTSSSSVTVDYVFNTDAGLTALGIAKPATSAGTELGDTEYIVGAITMTATSGGTATRVWNSSGTTDLRIYKNGTFTFTTSTGNIKSIVLVGNTVGGFTANTGSFSAGTWTGSATSVTLTATATEKINTISVTYE